jgi:hypothetical protein
MCPIVDSSGEVLIARICGKMKSASHLEWRVQAARAKAVA